MSRCYICDVKLSEAEIKYNSDYGRYNPCYTCINATPSKEQTSIDMDILEAMTAISEEEGEEDVNESTK